MRRILLRILWLVMFLSLLGASAGAAVNRTEPVQEIGREDLEAFLDGIITSRMDERKSTAVTLSVVKDGEILLNKGYGFADLQGRELVKSERALFRIGSTSKLFTWTAVMQMAEQGKLDLDEDIQSYLDFQLPSRLLDGSSSGPITLSHLLTHTPGFEDIGKGLFVRTEQEMTSLEEYLKEHVPARVFPPGRVLAYSNYGTALAGYIVELKSGLSFAQYVEQHIFKPLGMNNSTFVQPLPEDMASHLVQAYTFLEGMYRPGGFEFISGYPAGSMSTTSGDMAQFMIAHLQNGQLGDERILQQETVEHMHRQQFRHHPENDGMTYGFIEDTFNGIRAVTHGGNTQLFHTGLFLIPEYNLGLFISSAGKCIGRESLFQAFMDRYYPGETEDIPSPTEDARSRAAAYLGEYRPNRSNFTTYEHLLRVLSPVQVTMSQYGYLQTNLYGETIQLVEMEPGVYRQRYPDGHQKIGTLTFQEGPDGSMLMAPDGPMTFSRTPWYGSTVFLGSLTAGALLLLAGSILKWAAAFLKGLLKRRGEHLPSSAMEITARIAAVAFTLLTVVFFGGLIRILTDIDPNYGAPHVFYGLTPLAVFLFSLPVPILIMAGIMSVSAVLLWWRGYGRTGARIHYSIMTAGALGLCWLLNYINVI